MTSSHDDIITYLEYHLNTTFVGRQIHHYHSVSSTMEIAREMARKGAAEGTAVIADEQTAGRGRQDRIWLSPRGGIALSLVLHPPLNVLPKLVMIASLAMIQAIQHVTNIEAKIKWPNDVLIEGKKVCGILIENEIIGESISFAIIGIGINVNFDPMSFPDISAIATSLLHETGKEIPPTELLCSLLSQLEHLYLAARSGKPIHKEWQKQMETLGKWIQVKIGDLSEKGIAESVMPNGNLILRRADNSLVEIVAGDVTVIKD